MLSIHGSDDPTVPVQAVKEIGVWNPAVEVKIIDGAGHTFGGGHPFEDKHLPEHLEEAVGATIEFLKRKI
jgi:uncharacterized protein